MMDGIGAGGGTARLRSTDSANLVGVLMSLVQAALDRVPRSHVLRFLLKPDDVGGVRVAGQDLGHGATRPGVELLDPYHGSGHGSQLVSPAEGLDAHLARGQHDPLDCQRIGDAFVVQHFFERTGRERLHRRAGRLGP